MRLKRIHVVVEIEAATVAVGLQLMLVDALFKLIEIVFKLHDFLSRPSQRIFSIGVLGAEFAFAKRRKRAWYRTIIQGP